MPDINLVNKDCMRAMSKLPADYFDLAIVDPPYGIGADKPAKKPNKVRQKSGAVLNIKQSKYKHKDWDKLPQPKYFRELIRVSKNQIIWGVNHFNHFRFGPGRIIWDKLNGESDQYDCEIAYNSFNDRTDIIRYMWAGMFQGQNISKDVKRACIQIGNKKMNEKRIHPTQKPIKLYEWLLMNYASKGNKILDTHLGSGSIAIACHRLGFDLTGYEIDKEYYTAAVKRFNRHTAQLRML